jgi:hypothetical protein
MKKLLFTLFYFGMIFSGLAQSPGFRFGPRFGAGSSDFVSDPQLLQQNKVVLDAGISTCEQFNQYVGLETDFLFSKRGAYVLGTRQDGQDLFGNPSMYTYRDDYDLNYAQIPMLLKLSIGPGNFHFKVFGGPAMSFNLYSSQVRSYDNQDYAGTHDFMKARNDFNAVEYAAVYGLGFEIENPDHQLFFFDFRMNNGLTPLGSIEGRNVYVNAFTLHAGCMFK